MATSRKFLIPISHLLTIQCYQWRKYFIYQDKLVRTQQLLALEVANNKEADRILRQW